MEYIVEFNILTDHTWCIGKFNPKYTKKNV